MSLNPAGFVLPAIALGSGPVLFKPNQRGFFPVTAAGKPGTPIVAQATIEETGEDDMEITQHPVEIGAKVSDHAFKRPARVIIRCAWSNSPTPASGIVSQAVGVAQALFGNPIALLGAVAPTIAAAQSILNGNSASQVRSVYEKLLALQVSAIPFNILTGKRAYKNMLFQSLRLDTNVGSENSLPITAVCQEVILVATQVVTLNTDAQANPAATGPTQNQGNQNQQDAPTFMPDAISSVSGALDAAQGAMGQVTTMMSGAADFVAGAQGAVSQLPGTLAEVTGSVDSVLAKLPLPAEIPLIQGAQTFSIPLGSPDLGAGFSTALKELPAQLEGANTAMIAAAKQLPTLGATLPASLSTLPAAITTAQSTVTNALKQLSGLGIH